MEPKGIYLTYEELAQYIAQMTKEEKQQPVQFMMPQWDGDIPYPLKVAIGIDTVKYYCSAPGDDEQISQTRDVQDNQHHPERHIILADENPHDEDGNTHYELTPEGMVGNKTGKVYDDKGWSDLLG